MVRAWAGAVRRAEAAGVVGTLHSYSVGSMAARGGVSLWRRGCCILPALCDARAGASFGGGGRLARGFRWERSGRDGLAAGWMSGAELAGGVAVVADSRVRVLSIATRFWWDGREWSWAVARAARRLPSGNMAASVRGTRASPRRRAAAGWFHTRALRQGAGKRGTSVVCNASRIAPDFWGEAEAANGAGCAGAARCKSLLPLLHRVSFPP